MAKTKPQIVVGLDMSTEPKKQGVALGEIWADGRIEVVKVDNGNVLKIGEVLGEVLKNQSVLLLAIDSPLGWPLPMRPVLRGHRAGEKIAICPDKVFHRNTDEFIKENIGKRPLEVGANLIARTAHAACNLLGERGIPVLLGYGIPKCLSAIEVYPAATLCAHGWAWAGQGQQSKAEKEREKRRGKVTLLKKQGVVFQSGKVEEKALGDDDCCDACVCLLAARDFLRGECYEPSGADLEAAKVEGWIWVKRKP